MKEFKFKDLINGIENLPEDLLNYDSILYRIFDKSLSKSYIGTAKYGMPGRLYDGFHGHVIQYRANNINKCQGMYSEMNLRLDDFYLIIEDTDSPSNYDRILQKETEYIKLYDSVLFGYNVSIDGKPGWKEGSVCVNNSKIDLYIYQEDIPRFLENGFILGSCKHDFLKGSVWINNGKESKMVSSKSLDNYLSLGYSKGSNYSPNKGKVWVNNGNKSILIRRDLLNTEKYKEYKFLGRIESTPRKKRGKYKTSKKSFVNNGKKEFGVEVTKLEQFLKDNPSYVKGRLRH